MKMKRLQLTIACLITSVATVTALVTDIHAQPPAEFGPGGPGQGGPGPGDFGPGGFRPGDFGPGEFGQGGRGGFGGRGPGGFGGRGPGGFGGRGPGGFGGGPGGGEDRKLVKDFDQDENGWLNREERAKAREEAKSGGSGRRGMGGPGRGRGQRPEAGPGRRVKPNEVEHYAGADLYESTALRTLFFEFENEDWESELEDFHGTDVDVPAKLTVDGKEYPNVGMRFRGMSSYGMVPTGHKRSFNVSIDLANEDQRLYGYKTLNLLNSSGDPSFMSTVLYSHIASQYIAVPKANHVHVVINGESWGIYVNVQQFNKDFLKENFESSKGTRWKVSGNPNADGGLRYLGDDLEAYKQRFDMKSNDGKKAWKALVELCKTLNETPLDELESELSPMLDIDEALRFLALDVALVNSDGYWTRASDYSLFLDKDQRFHLIPHDMNEAFQSGGRGGRGPGGPGGRGGRGGPGDFGDGGPRGFGDGGPGGFGGPGFGGPGFGGPGFGRRVDQEGRGGFGPGGRQGGPGGEGGFGGPGGQGGGPRGQGGGPGGFGQGGPGGQGGFGARGRGRGPGGRGPGGRGPGGGPGHGGVDLDPLVSIDNDRMPLRSRLLAVPHLRERYLQYVREIAQKSLDWEQIEPVVTQHATLIAKEVEADTRKLDTFDAFREATSLDPSSESSLRSFFDKRREFLLKNPSSKNQQELRTQ